MTADPTALPSADAVVDPDGTAAAPVPAAEARASHRLRLPRDTEPADVLTMIRNVLPEAEEADGVIDLGSDARLVPDSGPRSAGRWTLEVPRLRDPEPAEDLPDVYGFARAFPEGMPYGVERQMLHLAWSLGRRLYGAVTTDGGVLLEPHPYAVRDLIVTSPNALVADDLLSLVQDLEPAARLDIAPQSEDAVGYSLAIPLDPDGGSDDENDGTDGNDRDEIVLSVGPSSAPTALAEVGWLEEAVDHTIAHLPADGTEDAVELPSDEVAARWGDAYLRIGRLAGLLVENLGGYVSDIEGFLVDPAHLA
jgi:hypothetical protein